MGYGTTLKPATGYVAVTSTDTELVAARAGATIQVAATYGMADAALQIVLRDGAGGTVKRRILCGANSGSAVQTPGDGQFWFETTAGNALVFDTTADGNAWIEVLYRYSQ